MIKFKQTTPEGQVVIEAETAKEVNEILRQLNEPIITYGVPEIIQNIHKYMPEKEPKDAKWPKRIRAEKAAAFIKEYAGPGVIAAFRKGATKEIAILTKSYCGTGRYVFLSVTDCSIKGNCYMSEGEHLDQVIKYMEKQWEVYAFKDFSEYLRYITKYMKG